MEVARRLIVEDPAEAGQCRRCLYPVGLYTFSVGWFSQCPNCLKGRIEGLLAEGLPLEGELGFTYRSVCGEVARHDERQFGELTVEMPSFYRCARCDALMMAPNARYYVPPGEFSSPPYCQGCYDELAR